MEGQLKGERCAAHPAELSCELPESCDLMVLGTPCNPFSTQRVKRYHPNSVMNHHLVQHTFSDTYQMIEKMEPANMIMEQTEGFGLPISVDDSTPPLQRPGPASVVICGCVFFALYYLLIVSTITPELVLKTFRRRMPLLESESSV